MTDYNAIIFDMDGTLIDSLNIWVETDKRFAQKYGKTYDSDLSSAMKTMHFESACEFLVQNLGLDISPKQAAKELIEIVTDFYLNDTPLKPSVREYLTLQRDKGIKMCVATSNDKSLASATLKNLGILEMFDFIITSDEVGSSKDSPEIFKIAAERLGSTPEKTLVFEDSLHALKSASQAGFYTVGIYDEFHIDDTKELEQNTQIIINNYTELM